MRCVEVRAGRPYEVFIGRGLMDAAGGMIVEALGGTRMAAILTDEHRGCALRRAGGAGAFRKRLRTCRLRHAPRRGPQDAGTWKRMLAFLSEQG